MTRNRTRTDVFASDVRHGQTTPAQQQQAARVLAGLCVRAGGTLQELADALEALGLKPYEPAPTLHRGRPVKETTP